MKIGFISSEIFPKINAGSVRMNSFIDSWSKKDEIKLYVFTEKKPKTSNYNDYGNNINIIRSFCKRASNKNNIVVRLLSEILLAFCIFINLLTRKMDIYFVSSPSFLLLISTLIASKVKKTSYIVDIRDIYPQVIFDNNIFNEDSFIGKLLVNIESIIYNNASKIVTVTKGLKNHIENKTTTPVYLIRNGLDRNMFYPKTIKSKTDNFIILFHGTLGRSQNLDLIINYAKYLNENNIDDIKIWVIGDGPKKDKIIRVINKFQLEDILIYYGFQDLKKIPNFINSADIGFSPRKNGLINKTAFPVKVYEYMGCGKPTIVTPISEVGNYLENNNIGFQFSNSELIKMHETILKLKNDKILYKKYCQNAINVSRKFERGKLANELYEILFDNDSRKIVKKEFIL
jgi:glycosyltransferase involved in cell wall biosynthesis